MLRSLLIIAHFLSNALSLAFSVRFLACYETCKIPIYILKSLIYRKVRNKWKCQNIRIYLLLAVCLCVVFGRTVQHPRCCDILFRLLPLFVGGLNWREGSRSIIVKLKVRSSKQRTYKSNEVEVCFYQAMQHAWVKRV